MKKFKIIFGALLSGFFNGIFGSGGGMLVVPTLREFGLSAKKAHATSVVVILVLSILSFVWYILKYPSDLVDALFFLPSGFVGALLGSFFLNKIKTDHLRRIFGILIIFSGLRLFLR